MGGFGGLGILIQAYSANSAAPHGIYLDILMPQPWRRVKEVKDTCSAVYLRAANKNLRSAGYL